MSNHHQTKLPQIKLQVRTVIRRANPLASLFGAKDRIVLQIREPVFIDDYDGIVWSGHTRWRDATPEDLVHGHEGVIRI